jgi:aminopeptidase
MTDPRIQKLSELLVEYSVGVKKGDRVCINGHSAAEPLIKAVYSEVLKSGGYPFLNITPNGISEIFFRLASDEQIKYIHEPERYIIENYDVEIGLMADVNTKALSNIDPEKMVIRHQARTDLGKTILRRTSEGTLRWVGTLVPTNAHAQDAEMSLSEYEDFVYTACMPDMKNPISYWKNFSKRQQKIIDWLSGKKRVQVIGNETKLELNIEGRKFINCDGKYNMPDGEIFTGPVEDSISGHVYFSYPAIEEGREVDGIRLWFENGRVIKATAEKNEDYLLKILETDKGSRYVGEFAIGTNEGITKFTRQILFDEKINGSFHMALGAGYPESGSKNESAIHWDMICDLRDGGEILVDDVLFYKNGKFTI